MARLSRREHGLITLGVVAAAAIGVYVGVIEPLRQQREAAAELIPMREATLARRQALVAQRAAIGAELEDVARRLESETGRLLQGPTPPLAASELQTLVKGLAQAAGVDVRSERVLAPTDRNGLLEIPLELTISAGLKDTVRLLAEVERAPKLLTVQSLAVRVVSVGQPRDLFTTLTVSGYLVPGAAAAPAPAAEATKS